ncbi:MAG: TetR family transcriptional regulator [Ideonella sp.]|nr:TetR family transcriptional regulator [Ideonella sp.]
MARPRSPEFAPQRAGIVRTATRLFAESGYPGTSMSDLAQACGISKALLYHYVDDKYQLLLEITEGHVSRLAALVAEVEAEGLAAEPRLRRLISRFVEEYAQARHDHGVLTQDVKFLADADRARVLATERQVVDAFARTIREARPVGPGGPTDCADLAKPLTMLLFGMMNWMFTWLRPDGRLGPQEMAPIVADLFLGGLAAVTAPPADAPTRRTGARPTRAVRQPA